MYTITGQDTLLVVIPLEYVFCMWLFGNVVDMCRLRIILSVADCSKLSSGCPAHFYFSSVLSRLRFPLPSRFHLAAMGGGGLLYGLCAFSVIFVSATTGICYKKNVIFTPSPIIVKGAAVRNVASNFQT